MVGAVFSQCRPKNTKIRHCCLINFNHYTVSYSHYTRQLKWMHAYSLISVSADGIVGSCHLLNYLS